MLGEDTTSRMPAATGTFNRLLTGMIPATVENTAVMRSLNHMARSSGENGLQKILPSEPGVFHRRPISSIVTDWPF